MSTNNPVFDQHNLFDQMANISKAHAYDVLVNQVKALKQVINDLISFGELEDVSFTNETETKQFQDLVLKAKILAL